MWNLFRDDRGSAGVFILGGLVILTIVFAATFWTVAGVTYDLRSYAESQMEQAAQAALMDAIQYDLKSDTYVISWPVSSIQQNFQQRMHLAKYSITKFQVLNKGDTDPYGHRMAQPGIYVQLSIPFGGAGHSIPIGTVVTAPPFNSEKKVYVN